jgi:hypothetical protein
MNKYYAGIGSRETPKNIIDQISDIASYLSDKNYILRSGHADGADLAFENSAEFAEIWLPWPNFNKQFPILKNHIHITISPNDFKAYDSVEIFHPCPEKLKWYGRKLMARNYRQIVGDIYSPTDSEFVICWTKDGKNSGGTGQALRIAESLKIPIYNLYFEGVYEQCLTI